MVEKIENGGMGKAMIDIDRKIETELVSTIRDGNENDDGENDDDVIIYCHRHSAVFSPHEVEVDTGLLKGKEIQLVPNYFPCIGEDCMLWCIENDSCQDTCEHNITFHHKK